MEVKASDIGIRKISLIEIRKRKPAVFKNYLTEFCGCEHHSVAMAFYQCRTLQVSPDETGIIKCAIQEVASPQILSGEIFMGEIF